MPSRRARWFLALHLAVPAVPATLAAQRDVIAPLEDRRALLVQRGDSLQSAGRPEEAARVYRQAAVLPASPDAGGLAVQVRGARGPLVAISSGSGFVVDAEGHVLTNKHVIRACSAVRVRTDALPPVAARLVATDPDDDLALLAVDQPALVPARFRVGAGPRPGDDVVVAGYPLVGLLADQMHVSVGTVNALAGMYNDRHNLQMSAPVQPGNSGGPLLDASGNVVGVVVTKLNARAVADEVGDLPQNVNFAIKADVAREFLDAQGVRYATAPSDTARSNADVGEIARRVTVMVECGREPAASRR